MRPGPLLPAPLADLLICLRFFTRLPLPVTSRETALGAQGFAKSVVMVPFAGALTGVGPALGLALARLGGLPPLVAAPLALGLLVALTGALHEDGLADCADGFGGGRTRERKLEIMRDSRIGTFGACALGLGLYLRAACLTVIVARSLPLACGILVATAAFSRLLCLVPLVLLPPARDGGAGAAAAGVSHQRFVAAAGLAFVLATLSVWGGAPPFQAGFACLLATCAVLALCALARREIGGQTGDVAGAAQQLAEISMLAVFAG